MIRIGSPSAYFCRGGSWINVYDCKFDTRRCCGTVSRNLYLGFRVVRKNND